MSIEDNRKDREDLGQQWNQNPYEGDMEGSLSQMDKQIPHQHQHKADTPSTGFKHEINENDDRDHGDSTKDWDAENSRTGRHK